MKFFTKSKNLRIILLLLIGLYIYGLWERDADIDDAWIGEHAYWLAEKGYVKSELMRGIVQSEDYLIIHHKLLTLHGALFIKLFGFSVYSLKSVSLIYFVVFLLLFYQYTVNWKGLFSKSDFLFSMIILISFPWLFKFSFIFRPEMILMTFGFISFILLEQVIQSHHKPYLKSFLAGLIGGLSITTHLNGLIVFGTGLIILLLYRKIKQSIVFLLAGIAGMALYFYDFNADYNFTFWLVQFRANPALDDALSENLFLLPLISLLEEYLRFFHNPTIFVFSFFFILSLFTGIKFLYRKHRFIFTYTLVSIFLMAVVVFHKYQQYILLYLPMMVIIMAVVWRKLSSGKIIFKHNHTGKIVKTLFIVSFISFIIVSNFANIELAVKKFSANDHKNITSTYIREDPSEVNIIAPMRFIFNEIKTFNRIQGEICYVEFQKSNPEIKGEGFFQKARSFDISYIILTPYYRDLLGLKDIHSINDTFGYKVLRNDELLIMKYSTE